MKTFARNLLPAAVYDRAAAAIKQLGAFKALATAHGQHRSMTSNMCVDGSGHPIPWYTYPAIEFFSHLDFSQASVFEYGSGNSSRWWSQRCKALVSVESDRGWFDTISAANKAANFNYLFAGPEQYPQQIQSFAEPFDIVIVDGISRADCAKYAVEHIVKHGGRWLILDNSNWYPKLMRKLAQQLRWLQVDFHGFGPINRYTWTTSVFVNPQSAESFPRLKALTPIAGTEGAADDDLK